MFKDNKALPPFLEINDKKLINAAIQGSNGDDDLFGRLLHHYTSCKRCSDMIKRKA